MLTGIYHQPDVRAGHRCITREAMLPDVSLECFTKTLRELLAAVGEAAINQLVCGSSPKLPISYETKISVYVQGDPYIRVDAWVPISDC